MPSLIKTDKEIVALREGGKRHTRILAQVAKAVRAGMTTAELDQLIFNLITTDTVDGAGKQTGDTPSLLNFTPAWEKTPYPASSCISINEEVVHGIPNREEKILKEGDIVSIDFGMIHKGMFTDAAVTVAVGEIDDGSRKLIHATQEALAAGIKAAKGEARVGDIGYAIEKVAKKYGYSVAEDLAGHGVGHAVHEDPYVPNYGKRGSGVPLRAGMVLAIEPMFNEGTGKIVLKKDGYTYRTADMKRSAHFEHTVLITEGEAEVLA